MKCVVVRLIALVCLASVELVASTLRPVDIPTRARGADRIVVATVSDVSGSFQMNEHGDQSIVSQVLLDVSEVLKGASHDRTLVVDVEGGTVGDLTMGVSDMPSLGRGDKAVFFLRSSPSGKLVPYLRGQGILQVDASDRVPNSSLTVSSIKAMVNSVRP